MSSRNEASSLVALRELRDMERRRLAEAAQAQAQAEKERRERAEARRRAEEEQRDRQEVARRAAEAHEAAESTRLRRDLDRARLEIAELLAQLERTSLARGEWTPPPASLPTARAGSHWFSWLGLSAGATMLVGALALTAAMRPRPTRAVSIETPVLKCPDPRPLAVTEAPPSEAAPAPPPPPKVKPRPRPSPRAPGAGKPPSSGLICDGTDPLCGLPLGVLDDIGKKPRKPPR
jgi:hypothetical protein